MKLSKFLFTASFVTFFSLLYVYQQTEIFRLAYVGQKKSVVFQDSLDSNTILRYNINKATSLTRLDNKISDYANFEMPENYRLVKLARPKEDLGILSQPRSLKRESLASIFFSIRRLAEASAIDR